ncbi:hypothetical protein VCHC52A1_1406, partial [Vibrio cholerae HC-52A1]
MPVLYPLGLFAPLGSRQT